MLTPPSHPLLAGSSNAAARSSAADALVEQEIEAMRARYGSYAKPPHKGRWLLFHNSDHVRQVHDAARATAATLVSEGHIPANDLPLIRIAAVFHDHDQDSGPGDNEANSAAAALEAMQDAHYRKLFDEQDLALVKQMIEATVVSFDGAVMRQSVTQTASDHSSRLQMVLADADLTAMAGPRGLWQWLLLLVEWNVNGGRLTAPESWVDIAAVDIGRDAMTSAVETQRRLLSGHRYYLEHSRSLLERGLRRNAEQLEQLAVAHERGATLGQLIVSLAPSVKTETGGAAGHGIGVVNR